MVDTMRAGSSEQDIARAAEVLREGGVVAFPTDTVYGVGAHALLPASVERLYTVKQRPRDKAIPLLLSDVGALQQVAASIPGAAYDLARSFWPGALTIVLRRSAAVPDAVTAGGETVAVRVPDHAVVHDLIAALGAPLAATSANLSDQPAPDTATGVLLQLDGRIDLLLDGGRCPGGVASTVVDLTVSPFKVLRQGAISEVQVREAIESGNART